MNSRTVSLSCLLMLSSWLAAEEYTISMYDADGTPAELVPAKRAAQKALRAAATAKGGGGTDTGIDMVGNVGFQRVLLIRVNFPDDMREFHTQGEVETVARRTADYFKENSYGLWQPQFDVTPLLTMPHTYLHYREMVEHVGTAGTGPLLADAVAAAAAVGFTGSYQHRGVCHRTMFSANTSTITLQGLGALTHELTHAYGIGHSTSWYCDGIGSYGSRDHRRFPNGSPGAAQRIYNIYRTHAVPYGDPYCVQGSGAAQYSTYWKIATGIMASSSYERVTSSGRYRVTAYDQAHLEPGRTYALVVPKNNKQDYYLGYRSRQYDGRNIQFAQAGAVGHEWLTDGLTVIGSPWDSSKENLTVPEEQPHLIDTTPGTPSSLSVAVGTVPPIDGEYKEDGAIAIGRTYSDINAGIHVTVVGKELSEPQALDVVVNIGRFPTNAVPTVTIAPRLTSLVGSSGQVLVPLAAAATATAAIEFVATATDADGDELAYSWDFGDCRNPTKTYDPTLPWYNTNQATCYHYWQTADIGATGRLITVRCTVSDMKGGVAMAFLKVNIDLPEFTGPGVNGGRTLLWGAGRIVDQDGLPLQGVRVPWVGTPYLAAYTDSNGYFAVPNLADGTNHQFDPVLEGYRFIGANDASGNTVVFSGRDKTQVDFIGYRRQTIAVTADADTVAIGARPLWTVTRTLPTTGSFTKPAVYTQPIDFLNIEPLFVRIYTDAGPLEWSADGGVTWVPVANFKDINLETPENNSQNRRESQNTAVQGVTETDPRTANPLSDSFIQFNAGITSIKVRRVAVAGAPTAATHYIDRYRLLAAFGVDYVAVPEEATVSVVNALPGTSTVTLRTDWGQATEDGSHTAKYTVVSDIAVASAITVPISATPGTAGLADIGTVPTSVTIEPNTYETSFTIAAVDDRVREAAESLTVSIGAGAGYGLGATTTGTMSIVADGHPRVNIAYYEGPARERNEGNTAAVTGTFYLRRNSTIEQDLVVGLNVTGTATNGVDYVTIPATVTIPAGRPSLEIDVVPLTDSLTEDDETVIVTLVDNLDYQVNNPGSATMIIQDAQLPDVSVAVVGTATVAENGGSVTVRFTRWRSTTGNLVVTFSLSGTALFGLDYTLPAMATRGQVTIPAGQASADLVLVATNDFLREIIQEDNEYVHFRVLPDPLNNYNVLMGREDAAVTITDDDNATNGTTVGWEVPSISVNEGASFSVDVVLGDWPIQPIDTNAPDPTLYARVDWAVVADATGAHPATLGSDVVVASGTETFIRQRVFADTVRRLPVTITIPADALTEFDETFKLVLSNPLPTSGASRVTIPAVQNGSDNLAECLVTVIDQNQGTLALSLSSASVTEGTSVTLTLTRTPSGVSSLLPVTIELTGTAVPGVHFSQFGADAVVDGRADQTRLITLAAGENSRTITLTTADNGSDETDRVTTFVATARGYTASSTVTLTIVNNDTDVRPMVSVVATDSYASETGLNTATVAFTRSSTATSLTVPYIITTDSTAETADYTALSGTVTFGVGIATVNLTLTPADDALVEDTETVIIALVAASSTEFQPGESPVATVWIADNDRVPAVVRVDTPTATVGEEQGATGHFGRFTLRRTHEVRGPLTVTVTIGGTATAGTDYTSIGTVTFPAGSTTVNVDVVPLTDALAEGDETVTLTVVDGTGYVHEPTAAIGTVTIVDNEAASISVAATTNGVETGTVAVVYTLTRSGGAMGVLSVDLTLTGGLTDPATPSIDTTVSTVTANFIAGATTTTVLVPVVDDATAEADETLVGTVGTGAGYVAGSPASDTALILDNDRPRVSLVITSVPLNVNGSFDIFELGTTSALLTVSSDLALASDLIVSYTLSGTASPGADFSGGQTGSVTLLAGAAPSTTITLTAMDDVLIEAPETIIITLTPTITYNLGTTTTTVNIISDDGTRVAVVGPPNHLIGAFSGVLTYRFYRLGDSVGGLRVNYSVVPDSDPTTTDLVNDNTAFSSLTGFFDMADAQTYYDLTITMSGTYVADLRRNLTIQVDTPTVLGSYVPGQVPGYTGGLGSATCQILRAVDTNVVKLTGTDVSATEGGVDTGSYRVTANLAFAAAQAFNLTAMSVLSTADLVTDYTMTTALVLPIAATTVNTTLSAPRDYLISEGNELVITRIDQPPVTAGPTDPAYWVVGLPSLITIIDGPAPQADIAISRTAVNIVSASTDYISGVLAFGTAVTYTYRIDNTGELTLNVGALTPGASSNLTSFSIDTTAVPAALPTVTNYGFTVTVTPTANGPWSLALSWSSDDPDESPFTWTIAGFAAATASGPPTGLGLVQGTADGGSCGFGNGLLGLLGTSLALLGLRRRRRN